MISRQTRQIGRLARPCYAVEPGAEGAAGSGDKATPRTVTMTEEELKTLIDNRAAQERVNIERRLGVTAKDVEELGTLRKEKSERDRKDAEAKADYDRALQSVKDQHTKDLAEVDSKVQTVTGELRRERCHGAVLAAASKSNAHNPDQVAILLDSRVKLDDNHQVVVLGEDGKPEYRAGKPLTVEQLVKEFLDGNKHLVKPAGDTGGAGGGRELSDTKTEGAEITKLEDAHKTAFERAQLTRDPSDITLAHAAKRNLDEARRKAKASK